MINFYTVVITICILSLISLAIDVGKNTIFLKNDIKWFRFTFLLAAFGALCEWGGIIFNNYFSEPNWVHAITTLAEFSVTPFFSVLLARSCGMKRFIKPLLLLMCTHFILEVILLPFGLIFYIDTEGNFQRGSLYFIYMIYCGLSFIYILLVFALIGKHSGLHNIASLIFIVLVTIIGQAACIYNGNIFTGYISITMTAILLYNYIQIFIRQQMLSTINIEQEIANHDSLTGVSSRSLFEKVSRDMNIQIKENVTNIKFAICECDLNNLKYINDTYGHEFGDNYIRRCCKVICDYFKHSQVFRLGGDEFGIVIKDDDFQNLNSIIFELHNFSISEAKKDSDFKERTSFASGYAIFDPEKDKTVSDVLRRADTEMYKNKKEIKSIMFSR